MACHAITYMHMHIVCLIACSCETVCVCSYLICVRALFCAMIIFAWFTFGACRPNLRLLFLIIESPICGFCSFKSAHHPYKSKCELTKNNSEPTKVPGSIKTLGQQVSNTAYSAPAQMSDKRHTRLQSKVPGSRWWEMALVTTWWPAGCSTKHQGGKYTITSAILHICQWNCQDTSA